jgi:hypothetical protein
VSGAIAQVCIFIARFISPCLFLQSSNSAMM